MLHIGNHLSSSKGYLAMGQEAVTLSADTFAFFTRNPRGGQAKAINETDVFAFREFSLLHNITSLVAHAPYTMNLCATKEHLRDFSQQMLSDDLHRMEYIPGNFYNFHPGSHVGQGCDKAINFIAQQLNQAIFPSQTTTILLETMSGKGTEIGRDFEELQSIIQKVYVSDKVGVCLDTCHVWDAGYDIVNNLDGVLSEFDQIIGLDRLKAIHLNDSLNPLGSHKDRHARIGEGEIGLEAIIKIINHPKLRTLPFILETPNDHEGYAKEIALLRSHYEI